MKHTSPTKGGMSPRTARLVFGEDGVRAIRDLRVIANAKQAGRGEVNYSKTGNTVQQAAGGLRNLVLTGLGFSAGDITGAVAAPLAGNFLKGLGEKRAARMLTNPDFTKWLRTLPDTANPDAINRSFDRLRRSASRSPVFAADVQALERALIGAANDNPAGKLAAEDQNAQE